MFGHPQSEADFDNEKIEYRIVTKYEDAYKYNSPGGYRHPKTEVFTDVNEKNYNLESRKRERQEKNIRDRENKKNNPKDSKDDDKTVWGIIAAVIFFILEAIF